MQSVNKKTLEKKVEISDYKKSKNKYFVKYNY